MVPKDQITLTLTTTRLIHITRHDQKKSSSSRAVTPTARPTNMGSSPRTRSTVFTRMKGSPL